MQYDQVLLIEINVISHMMLDVSGSKFPSSSLTNFFLGKMICRENGEGKTGSRYDVQVKVYKLSQWKKKEARGLQS